MTNVVEHPTVTDRTPPNNLMAEMQLIGAVLTDNRAYDMATDRTPLRAEHFADPAHRIVWETIARSVNRGHQASPTTLKNILEHNELLAEVGGTAYLSELANSVLMIENAGDLAAVIHEAHLRRGLIEACEWAIDGVFGQPDKTAGRIDGRPQCGA